MQGNLYPSEHWPKYIGKRLEIEKRQGIDSICACRQIGHNRHDPLILTSEMDIGGIAANKTACHEGERFHDQPTKGCAGNSQYHGLG